jgi:cyclopropane fatty-acyl-phospholipid synthase-like methyltransferase
MPKMDVCPWWLGYLLACPIRHLFENPDKLLRPFIRPGMTVLDLGCAMGFFTIPAARLVGEKGRVIAVDLQPRMISALKRRLARRGLLDRVETRVCGQTDLALTGLGGQVDLALAIHVVHEVPDRGRFFAQVQQALKSGGRLLFVEPKGHVSAAEFESSIETARTAGLALPGDGLVSERARLLVRP